MGNIYKPIEQELRLSDEYVEAKMLFEERRQAQERIAEINRALREIDYLYSAAVQVARSDVPFRKPHGRPKLIYQTVLVNHL